MHKTNAGATPLSIHHIEFYVSNALQSSQWYCLNFGFRRFAKKDDKQWRSIGIRNGNVVFIFTTCKVRDEHFIKHLTAHGDSIKDVAFEVEDIGATIECIVEGGGFLVKPMEAVVDESGSMKTAVVATPDCDVCHTLLSLTTYRGFFLPYYEHWEDNSSLLRSLEETPIRAVDHFVLNYPVGVSENVARYYFRVFGLEEIWTVDDSICNTKHSAMKVLLLANKSQTIQLTLVEPIPKSLGVRSQIQEFLDYHGGAGVQHVAFLVNDIIKTVEKMKRRGVEFIAIPDQYYTDLKSRLAVSHVQVEESLDEIKKRRILMDFDDHGYLLQIFTQPVQDRPTLFFEIIQRNNYSGFGERNVKALYDAMEKEQEKRGTLYKEDL